MRLKSTVIVWKVRKRVLGHDISLLTEHLLKHNPGPVTAPLHELRSGALYRSGSHEGTARPPNGVPRPKEGRGQGTGKPEILERRFSTKKLLRRRARISRWRRRGAAAGRIRRWVGRG